ncbi:hypothetical protein [Desulfurivibrio sp. C05AmB]|jgi:hypothetical protein|uniref:hypothetical protein n=1 Tax=Desulfurivibrio sp. C05AmB TaxID=3374371 RepID=UPI00376F20AB
MAAPPAAKPENQPELKTGLVLFGLCNILKVEQKLGRVDFSRSVQPNRHPWEVE